MSTLPTITPDEVEVLQTIFEAIASDQLYVDEMNAWVDHEGRTNVTIYFVSSTIVKRPLLYEKLEELCDGPLEDARTKFGIDEENEWIVEGEAKLTFPSTSP